MVLFFIIFFYFVIVVYLISLYLRFGRGSFGHAQNVLTNEAVNWEYFR